ncbi:protocadherin-10-like [Latimeria chalumnae]|uniref:protocadherin-10-like n=1 Tax=Latimeria chalumnae TaxID=7897 RepID=UPI0006D92B57|nr:PREDICTED: protocadherin-10-like [Latimeria chalumnae]|eukprot:XP_014350991.1 PREDICTED: protocadherin-10-like [Latimeria chalumnae]
MLQEKYLCFFCLSFLWDSAFGQIHYSIPEELEHGAIVGNIADDLGLDVIKLPSRRFRIASTAQKRYLKVNLQNGILFLNEKLDREQLCEQKRICLFNIDFILENPLEMHYAEIEILDINDNSPSFAKEDISLSVTESALVGTRIPLEGAQDPDSGTNSLARYHLSLNENFGLDTENRGEDVKIPVLVLEKALDREEQSLYHLLLTAIDGGIPERSGSVRITITVLDSNDNAPLFDQKIYFVNLFENSSKGTLVIKLNATDADEGSNGDVNYYFSSNTGEKVKEMFSLGPHTGEIRVVHPMDFEETNSYQIEVQARDRGHQAMQSHCTIVVKIVDVNDNAPVLSLSSLTSPIEENIQPGTIIALISVTDQDSDENSKTRCYITPNTPFKLIPSVKANVYSLITDDLLDREIVSEYNISITAIDLGSSPLSSSTMITVKISDINDNAPQFDQSSYTVYVMENNLPDVSIFAINASDFDSNENARIVYSILETGDSHSSVFALVSLSSENGNLFASSRFDFEQLKYFSFLVQAQDCGIPSLSSSTTVSVFILDQNDSAPQILTPVPKSGSIVATEIIGSSVEPGYLITKIRAYDADIGYNAWLSFQLLQSTDPSIFTIGTYTGEIRTRRPISDRDTPTHTLEILVKDNGKPSLSTTLIMAISILDSTEDSFPPKISSVKEDSFNIDNKSNLTVYLIITLGSVSFMFVVSIVVLITIQCFKVKSQPLDQVYIPYTEYCELNGDGSQYHNYHYRMCLSQESTKSQVTVIKPLTPTKTINCGYLDERGVLTNKNGTNTSSMELPFYRFLDKVMIGLSTVL